MENKILELTKNICRVTQACHGVCNPTNKCNAYKYAKRVIEAGYEPKNEGEWELGKSGCMYFCSSCKYAAHPREEEEWSFCPNCGAKMKGGAE